MTIPPPTPEPAPPTTPPVIRYLRAGFASLTTLYILGLAVYLALRLLTSDSLWWMALLNNFTPYYFLPLLILIPLAILQRLWWTVARLLLLACIGLAAFGPYFLPKARAAPAGPAFKLVTFNIFPYNTRLDDVEAWLRTVDADIVLLQEIPARYSDDGALHDRYRYQRAQQPAFPDEATIIEGGMILSRYPIQSVENFRLEDENTGLFQQRITLNVHDQPIAVYNIHLLMPVGETPRLLLPAPLGKLEFALKYDDRARNAQITRLLDRLQAESLPYIVAGDFNMSDQAAIYHQLASRLTDSFREAGIGLGGSWPAGASEELPDIFLPLLRLDYIWHSPHFRAAEAAQGPPLGSDHLPLYAVLELAEPVP